MTAPTEQAAGTAAAREVPAGRTRRPGRKLTMVSAVIVLAAGAVTVWVIGPFRPSKAAPAPSTDPTSLTKVIERSLSSQTEASGVLGYSGSYSVVIPASAGSEPSGTGQGTGSAQQGTSQSPGTFTALPTAGSAVRRGRSLYSVSGSPVALLYGSTPAYRSLSEGMSGADVRELNANLVALGDATSSELAPDSSYFSAASAAALEKLQAGLGLQQTGSLPLGRAVFLPTAVTVSSVSATLGGPAQPGAPVLQATSTTRQVTAQLDATEQSDVKAGQQVSITLPDNQTTPGVVTSIGTVASNPSADADSGSGSSSSGSGSSSSGSAATIDVYVKPADPAALGTLDQAPVQVTVTTATVSNALVVPIDALLGQANGYAVEVAAASGGRHLVPVTLGLFDDADGLVQVSGRALAADQSVVVPKI